MSEDEVSPPAVGGSTVAGLARGVRLKHDKVRERTILLAPERTIALDDIGVAIVSRLDGEKTVDALLDELAAAYDAPRDVIEKDVVAFLQDLANRRLLELDG